MCCDVFIVAIHVFSQRVAIDDFSLLSLSFLFIVVFVITTLLSFILCADLALEVLLEFFHLVISKKKVSQNCI